MKTTKISPKPIKRYTSLETFVDAKLKDASESLKNVDLSILKRRTILTKS